MILATALCVAVGAWELEVARTRHVFDLQGLESRFVVSGRYAAGALPANALVLAATERQSRYHGRRMTIVDAIPSDGLDRTIAWLATNGFQPFIALEDGEEPRFRARFATERFGRLDWPAAAEVHAPVLVRLYEVAGREGYRTGARPSTVDVR